LANKEQIELQTKSQPSLMKTLNSRDPKTEPRGTQNYLVCEREKKPPEI